MKYTYLTAGPSELYYTVDFHLKQALKSGIPSISHRSKEFQSIYASIKENLATLLSLPADYKIFFTSSATEVWERIAQNLISSKSYHFSNGAFADKFISTVNLLGKQAIANRMQEGQGFDIGSLEIPDDLDVISITQNETSTGTRFPLEDIYRIRELYPEKLITVDAVSSIPCEIIDFSKIDSLYFSVQKCFGLPAGLGVWLVNERCIKKAIEMEQQGQILGSYHSIPSLLKTYEKDQTPETPNVLGIYLFGKVLEDMLDKGIDQIRREINYKAALTYQSVLNHELLEPFVKEESIRSKTVIVANIEDPNKIVNYFKSNHFIVGKGYGGFKNNQIRIANFPTHSKETFEKLADLIEAFSSLNS
jgi:phosphoserine aminotransferase